MKMSDVRPAAHPGIQRAPWLNARLSIAAPFAAILVLWYALTASGAVSAIFLPTPAATLRSLAGLMNPAFFTGNLLPSLFRIGGAFLLSAAIALPLGVASGYFAAVGRVVIPLCSFTRYLPVPAIVPLCILWFGIDDGQKIAVIAIGCVFQLLILVSVDTATVPLDLVEAGRTFGLSETEVVRRIILPWAMPSIWEDLRVCAGWAWSYLVLAELVAGNSGIGYFIIQSQRYLQTDHVFAGILMIGLLGLLTDGIFRFSARRLFRWT